MQLGTLAVDLLEGESNGAGIVHTAVAAVSPLGEHIDAEDQETADDKDREEVGYADEEFLAIHDAC